MCCPGKLLSQIYWFFLSSREFICPKILKTHMSRFEPNTSPQYPVNSLRWQKLTFSKLRFSKLKIFIFRSVFCKLQLTQTSLNFKTSCCNLKNKIVWGFFLLIFRFWDLFHFKQNCTPIFHVKRRDRKGINNFPPILLKSFMITTRECLSHFEKTFITESDSRRSSS